MSEELGIKNLSVSLRLTSPLEKGSKENTPFCKGGSQAKPDRGIFINPSFAWRGKWWVVMSDEW